MTVPHLIQISEEIPLGGRDHSEGAGTKHFEPLEKPKHIKDEQEPLPDMSVYADSTMKFLTAIPARAPSRPEHLIEDTIEVGKGFDFHDEDVAEEETMQHIRGNLTCLRENDNAKLSNKIGLCYGGLCMALEKLSYKQIKQLAHPYFTKPPSTSQDEMDRNFLLDGIAGIRTNYNHDLLTDLVFNAPNRNPELMIRLLEHVPFFQTIKSQKLIEAVEQLAITQARYKGSEEEVRLRELATFIIGAIAKILREEGRYSEAEQIVEKIHQKVGIFDPWHHRRRRSTMSHVKLQRYERDIVVLLGALGNAAHPKSADYILSFTNSTDIPKYFQESGLHALENFHTPEAADALVRAWKAETNPNFKRSYKKLCKENPVAHSLALRTEPDFNDSFVKIEPGQSLNQTGHIHSRGKRSARKALQLLIPLIEHLTDKEEGDRFIGGNYGGTSSSTMDILSDPQATTSIYDISTFGAFKFLLRMFSPYENFRASFQEAHLHLASLYNMNILEDYGVDVLANAIRRLDQLLSWLIPKLIDAINMVIGSLNLGLDLSVGKLVDCYLILLDETTKLPYAEVLDELGVIDLDNVPEEILVAVYLIRNGEQLTADVKADLIQYLEEYMGQFLVELPWDVQQIYKTVKAMKAIVENFHDNPKEAITDLLKMFDKTEQALNKFTEQKKRIEEKIQSLKGLQPEWYKDIRNVVEEKKALIREIDEKLRTELEDWANENIQQRKILNLVRTALNRTNDTLAKIKQISEPFKEALSNFTARMEHLNETVINILKGVIDSGRFEIEEIFGVRFHQTFPRVFREQSDICPDDGFYPTTNSYRFSDYGVDLLIGKNQPIVTPLSGFITLLGNEKIQLDITSGSITDTILTIDNILPQQWVSDTPVKVYKGDGIGFASRSNCQPNNYIHVVMKKQNNGETGYIDPSPFLEKVDLKCPKFDFGRNSYLIKYKGITIMKENLIPTTPYSEDSTPARSSPPPTDTIPIEQHAVLTAGASIQSPATFSSVIGLPEPTSAGPSLGSFSFADISMCSVMEAIELLKDNKLKQKVIDTLIDFKSKIDGLQNFLPNQLTDDYLRTLLQERGLPIWGDRLELLARFSQPDNLCPLLMVAMRRTDYCRFERNCLGVECRIPIEYKSNVYPLTVFVRYNPDTEELDIGLGEHNITNIMPDPLEISKEVVLLEGGWKQFGKELIVGYSAGLENGELYIDMKCQLCSVSDRDDCEPVKDILTDMLIPIPFRYPNGSLAWKDSK
ncbi:uncharacterized protein [Antedon mediterranea]|uniref:uncharacterized protein n=1 Tax=Antedon mediterranea TaxID=105859 RepID=UPI003AF65CEB